MRWKAFGQHQHTGGVYAQFTRCIREGRSAAAKARSDALRAERQEQRHRQREEEIAAGRRLIAAFEARDVETRRRALAALLPETALAQLTRTPAGTGGGDGSEQIPLPASLGELIAAWYLVQQQQQPPPQQQ